MEFSGSCYAVGWLENKFVKELVQRGQAKYTGTTPNGIETGKTENNKFFTKKYVIFVGEDSAIAKMFEVSGDVSVRFCYDMRNGNDHASIRSTKEGFLMLFNSMTIQKELKRINFKVTNKKGKIDPRKVEELVTIASKARGEEIRVNVDLE